MLGGALEGTWAMGSDDPQLRSIDEPNIRLDPDASTSIGGPGDTSIGGPGDATAVDNADIRPWDDVMVHEVNDGSIGGPGDTSIGGPGDTRMVHDVDNVPAPAGGSLFGMPRLLVFGAAAAVVVVAAIVALNSGGPSGPAAPHAAQISVTGGGIDFDGPAEINAEISPTATLIAAVWTSVIENVSAGYADQVVLTITGPVISGSEATSEARIVVGVSVSRVDASGNDVFSHVFTSKDGECSVTMSKGASAITGSVTCSSLGDADGHTAKITAQWST